MMTPSSRTRSPGPCRCSRPGRSRRICRPERAAGRLAAGAVTPEVPRPRPVADDDVSDQRSVRARITPRPAVPGRHPRRNRIELRPEHLLQLVRSVRDVQLNAVVALPRLRAAGRQAEQVAPPSRRPRCRRSGTERSATILDGEAAATQHAASMSSTSRSRRAARPDAHRAETPARGRPRSARRSAVCRCAHRAGVYRFADVSPDPVRLIEDEDVQAVRLRIHELIEVLEQALRPRRALSGDLPQGLGERPGAGRVKHRVPGGASSPSSDNAITLLPLPGPPSTTTAVLCSAAAPPRWRGRQACTLAAAGRAGRTAPDR